MQPLRQGDVILIPQAQAVSGDKLQHLTLAEGEVTGHRHRISEGEAELYERNGTLYLKVLSPTALLTHEEHNPIAIPQGTGRYGFSASMNPRVGATWRIETESLGGGV